MRGADGSREYVDMGIIGQDLRIWLELEIPLIEDGNSFGRSGRPSNDQICTPPL